MQKFQKITAVVLAALSLGSIAAVTQAQAPASVPMPALSPELAPQRVNLNRPTASVIPTEKTFKVQFDEAQIDGLYKEYAADKANAVKGKVISKEEFRRMIENSTVAKLKAVFPNGWPSAADTAAGDDQRARVKPPTITIGVSLKPLRITVKLEW
jgi:hypothetical protein